MNTKLETLPKSDIRIAYVRPVNVAELPQDIRDEAAGLDQVFAVHNADGERLALVKDKQMAFLLARNNDFVPHSVH